ncbi:unnamed protein product [Symbiodinium sp. CCMP2456]|nr:unnamed protein product [Symbiodinium sp. CCMP2456]
MAPTNDTIGRPFVKEGVGDSSVVKVWTVPHEFVGKVVFAVNDAVGNAASGVADNMEVESAAEVVIVPAELLCRQKEGASARVSEKVVLWDKSKERDGNMAIVKVLASALGRLIWFPMSVDLSPVVNVILYPWVSCEDDSGGGGV